MHHICRRRGLRRGLAKLAEALLTSCVASAQCRVEKMAMSARVRLCPRNICPEVQDWSNCARAALRCDGCLLWVAGRSTLSSHSNQSSTWCLTASGMSLLPPASQPRTSSEPLQTAKKAFRSPYAMLQSFLHFLEKLERSGTAS